ncbi:hypothetical protein BLOT_015451 [Blomia tropicalis]|nr:hypothetical protein BLOT_015451 [Blomia tropicalis]
MYLIAGIFIHIHISTAKDFTKQIARATTNDKWCMCSIEMIKTTLSLSYVRVRVWEYEDKLCQFSGSFISAYGNEVIISMKSFSHLKDLQFSQHRLNIHNDDGNCVVDNFIRLTKSIDPVAISINQWWITYPQMTGVVMFFNMYRQTDESNDIVLLSQFGNCALQ